MHALPASALAFAVAVLALPLWARAARRLGLVDAPGPRSTHARPVPRVGGLAIALGLAAGLGGLWRARAGALGDAATWAAYLVPALGFLAVGLLDDRVRLRARWKLLLQAAVAALAVALGLRWGGGGLGPFGALAFGAATPWLTWLWIVAVVTLVNLLDGLDLITALGAIVLLALGAGGGAGPGDGALYAVAAAAVLGYAPWNLAPARAFPGDAGTHLLGFLVATLALEAPGSSRALPWALASAPLLPGVLDLAWGLAMKARHGVPLGQAHDQHLSQRLLKVGASHAGVAVRYALLALLGAVLVGWLAPRLGLAACLALGAAALAAHLGLAWRRTRTVPYRFSR